MKYQVDISKASALVRRVARRYNYSSFSHEDIMQEGFLGLLEAQKRYNPDSDGDFAYFAQPWIRKYIQQAVSCYAYPVRLPKNVPHNIPLLPEQIDQPVFSDPSDSDITLGDILLVDSRSPEDDLLIEQRKEELFDAIHSLPPRQQRIITASFGLDGTDELSCAQLADELHISPANVRKLKERALRSLRKVLAPP